jgi:hypothetical protein
MFFLNLQMKVLSTQDVVSESALKDKKAKKTTEKPTILQNAENPLQITEILERVVSHLGRESVQTCRLVNDTWNKVSSRRLMQINNFSVRRRGIAKYRDGSTRGKGWDFRKRFMESAMYNLNCWEIDLRVWDKKLLQLLESHGKCLKFIKLSYLIEDKSNMDLIRNILTTWCPNINQITLDFQTRSQSETWRKRMDEIPVEPSPVCLKGRLVPISDLISTDTVHPDFEFPLPELKSVKILDRIETSPYIGQFLFNVVKSCPNITDVFVRRMFCRYSVSNPDGISTFLNLLSEAPDVTRKLANVFLDYLSTDFKFNFSNRLEALTLWGYSYDRKNLANPFLPKVLNSEASASIKQLRFVQDEEIAREVAPLSSVWRFENMMPSLTCVTIQSCFGFGMNMFDLLDAAPNLTHLNILDPCQNACIRKSSMQIKVPRKNFNFGDDLLELVSGDIKPHQNLQSLRIELAVPEEKLPVIFEKVPNLQTLSLAVGRWKTFEPSDYAHPYRIQLSDFGTLSEKGEVVLDHVSKLEKLKNLTLLFIDTRYEFLELINHLIDVFVKIESKGLKSYTFLRMCNDRNFELIAPDIRKIVLETDDTVQRLRDIAGKSSGVICLKGFESHKNVRVDTRLGFNLFFMHCRYNRIPIRSLN